MSVTLIQCFKPTNSEHENFPDGKFIADFQESNFKMEDVISKILELYPDINKDKISETLQSIGTCSLLDTDFFIIEENEKELFDTSLFSK